MNENVTAESGPYELHFRSLGSEAGDLCFRCDAAGRVPLDTLSEEERNDYLFARICVGRDFASPVVRPATMVRQASATNRALGPVRNEQSVLAKAATQGLLAQLMHWPAKKMAF